MALPSVSGVVGPERPAAPFLLGAIVSWLSMVWADHQVEYDRHIKDLNRLYTRWLRAKADLDEIYSQIETKRSLAQYHKRRLKRD